MIDATTADFENSGIFKAVAGGGGQYSDLMKGGVLEFTMGPKPVAL